MSTTERISAKDFLAMQGAGAQGKKKAPSTDPSESDIQATLVQALKQCGYEVFETGQDRSKLHGRLMKALRPFLRGDIAEAFVFNLLGKVLREWGNNDTGTPDLLVTHADWPSAELLGLELKTPAGRVRPEQQRLADLGRVVIVRSVTDGLRVVRDREEKMARGSIVAWKLTTHYRIAQMVEQFAGTAGDCLSAVVTVERAQ